MRNITKTKRQQNQGFSLFTVLIAVSFVGILGLLVLYIALSNFNMKITDLKGKDSFYTAERALEEIRTGLQEDVGNAMSKAYTQVLESYNVENRSQDSSMDRQRQSEFQDCFITELMRTLRVSKTEDNIYNMERLRGYVDLEYDNSKESLIITGISGYRSYKRQQQLSIENPYVASPGTSEHQSGLALDVSCPSIQYQLIPEFAETPEGKWLKRNASLYGFIIRYPANKEPITGIPWEPWHIRYVTRPLAGCLRLTGLTLEEYYSTFGAPLQNPEPEIT